MLERFGPLQEKYIQLWKEFEEGTSIEGKLVRAADKLELMVQVLEYEKIGYRSLDKFWENPWNYRNFDDFPLVQEIMDLLYQRREDL